MTRLESQRSASDTKECAHEGTGHLLCREQQQLEGRGDEGALSERRVQVGHGGGCQGDSTREGADAAAAGSVAGGGLGCGIGAASWTVDEDAQRGTLG